MSAMGRKRNVRNGWKADVRLIVRREGVSEEPSTTESNGSQCQGKSSRRVAFNDPHEKVRANENDNENGG